MQFEGEFWGKRLSSKSRGWGNKVEIQLEGNPGQSKCAEMSFDPLSHDFSTLSDRLSLVTQPMLQRRPNRTELRSMDSYNQIFSRFQKFKRKVPPGLLLSNEKSP